MSDWLQVPIESLLEKTFPGEWGSEPLGSSSDSIVFRGADFNQSGRLPLNAGVPRCISAEKLKKIALLPGDILIEKSGGSPEQPVGRVSIFQGARGEAVSSNFLQTLRPARGIDSQFLFYLLQFEYRNGRVLAFQQQTTGLINFKLKDYLKEIVYIPKNEAEQRGIAEVLSALDEQIEATEDVIKKLNLQRNGLTADLLMCHHLTTTEFEDIRLSAVVPSVQYGISSSLTESGVVPVLRMNNLSGGEIDVSDLKYSPTNVTTDLLLNPGDVLFNRTNSMEHVGRTSIWRGQVRKCTYASYLVRLSPDTKRLLPEYLVYLLEWDENQQQMRKYATPGVQQVNINPTSLRRCKVRIPKSLDMQLATIAALDAARENFEYLKAEVAKLRLQKQGLMQDLLSGDVRVSGAH